MRTEFVKPEMRKTMGFFPEINVRKIGKSSPFMKYVLIFYFELVPSPPFTQVTNCL